MKQEFTRIAVKVGSNVLARRDGTLDVTRMSALVDQIAELNKSGVEIILISSGAVASGRSEIHPQKKLDSVDQRQLFSAVGQAKLINRYYELFREHGIAVGQVLTTKENFSTRRHYLNQKNCMTVMLENGVIPIVNENDTVAIDELELEVGENDSLAANVATIANADLLVIMSDIDGLYDKDPHVHEDARLIPEVGRITDDIRDLAGGAGSALGTGGMATKIKAVEIAHAADIDVVLMNGKNPRKLYDLFEDKPVGTIFAKQ